MTEKQDVYTRITNQIIEDLEKGVRPWSKPWSAENTTGRITLPLRHNGQAYQGINILSLWGTTFARGYGSPYWMTFKQAVEYGACVQKGEKGSLVVFANKLTRKETDDAGDEIERQIPYMKGYTVFNAEQIEGLPSHFYAKPEPTMNPVERIDHAEAFFAALGADIRHGGNQAYYAQESDYIRLPLIEAFVNAESYYATLAHEGVHWTKHPKRLGRDLGRKTWGDEGYAREELVAELGAAFLCAQLELELRPREDHASYIASWLKVLKDDKKAIFSAAAHAQRAVDFIHGYQKTEARAA